jgi:NTE family protein
VTDSRERRALVLGGGGLAGIAWETGFLAGLAEHGVQVADATIVVGTSAGATVAAQLTSGAPLHEMLETQLETFSQSEQPVDDVDMPKLMADVVAMMSEPGDARVARRKIGALALKSDRVPEAERRAIVEARLSSGRWPTELRVTAVDAVSGEFAVFDSDSGVSVVDAVAASAAVPVVWPAVTIGGRRYIDGGTRSAVNADVAHGYDRVLVLEPLTLPETSDVVALGEETELLVIKPGADFIIAQGANHLDPAIRPACARAGHRQAMAMAEEVRAFWCRAPTPRSRRDTPV